ncbi:hypothetical protein JTE90_011048 [Oedothorax gibbosus]|uniref:Secreted protein n=1 Tax=Oedothorax gibbosus TaxID=931172 RepID=A0AAV6VEI9_9ARAC|nr:hypothetical protein JTE90_011048 [Oedothorax gibbosus]
MKLGIFCYSLTMISTDFFLISLTAVTVVLASMPFKGSRAEKVADFTVNSGEKMEKQERELSNGESNELTQHYNKGMVGIALPADTGVFERFRKSTNKKCNILVQTTETQNGRCIRLADNTPACHNDQYLAVNPNDC